MIEQYDSEHGYCRKLGHHLHFKYCRSESSGKPCTKILDCWFEKFDVAAFMNEYYSDWEIEQISGSVPDKTETLFDLIQKAQARNNRTS